MERFRVTILFRPFHLLHRYFIISNSNCRIFKITSSHKRIPHRIVNLESKAVYIWADTGVGRPNVGSSIELSFSNFSNFTVRYQKSGSYRTVFKGTFSSCISNLGILFPAISRCHKAPPSSTRSHTRQWLLCIALAPIRSIAPVSACANTYLPIDRCIHA